MAPVFPLRKCLPCQRATPEWVCSFCHQPAGVNPELDFFQLLGWERPFLNLSLDQLRQRFYERSRVSHPDYVLAEVSEEDPSFKSLEQASVQTLRALNQAYETLRSPQRRRAYVLQRYGEVSSGGEIPADLQELSFRCLESSDEPWEVQKELQEELQKRLSEVEFAFQEHAASFDTASTESECRGWATAMQPLWHRSQLLQSLQASLKRSVGEVP